LAIINLLVPLPEFNVLGTLLKHRESHLGYGLDNLGFNSWQMQETFSSPKHPCQLWKPTQPPIQQVQLALSQGEERPGNEADQSPPLNADDKNKQSLTSTSICLCGVHTGIA